MCHDKGAILITSHIDHGIVLQTAGFLILSKQPSFSMSFVLIHSSMSPPSILANVTNHTVIKKKNGSNVSSGWLKAKCSPVCSKMHMVKPVMEDARATPI